MPFPENAPRVDDLTLMPPQDIVALPVEMLAILQREIDEAAKRVKTAKACLDGALTSRACRPTLPPNPNPTNPTEKDLIHDWTME